MLAVQYMSIKHKGASTKSNILGRFFHIHISKIFKWRGVFSIELHFVFLFLSTKQLSPPFILGIGGGKKGSHMT